MLRPWWTRYVTRDDTTVSSLLMVQPAICNIALPCLIPPPLTCRISLADCQQMTNSIEHILPLQSELAFRQLCFRYGATAAYTPMLHSRLFLEDPKYRAEHFTTCPSDRYSPQPAVVMTQQEHRILGLVCDLSRWQDSVLVQAKDGSHYTSMAGALCMPRQSYILVPPECRRWHSEL